MRLYTTLPVHRDPLVLTCEYDPAEHPRYDNYDAVEVSRTDHIPRDYDGVMGAPISFLEKHDSRQFEIVGIMQSWDGFNPTEHGGFISGQEMPKRIFIRHRRIQ